jgi:hypothetical protein
MNVPLEQIAKEGLGWALFVGACAVIAYLYREKNAETNARIQDAKDHASVLLRVQQGVHDTISKVHEFWKGGRR